MANYLGLAAAILDRILERGRFIHLDGPSGMTRHLNLQEVLPATEDVPEFPEPTERGKSAFEQALRAGGGWQMLPK